MKFFKVSLTIVVASLLLELSTAAPQPLSIEEVGRKLNDFGKRILPAIRGVCGLVNSFPTTPRGYYQPGNSQYNGYYPQVQGYFPDKPRTFHAVSSSKDQQNTRKGASEQEDMLRNSQDIMSMPAPEIEEILRNFEKLPMIDPHNFRNAENQVIEPTSESSSA